MFCVQKRYPALFNSITTDTQIKRILKIVLPNISVSSEISHNGVTNYNHCCGRVLQKFFLESMCFLPSKFVYAWMGNLQLLTWLLPVKLRASLFMTFVFYINFLDNKITSMMFIV